MNTSLPATVVAQAASEAYAPVLLVEFPNWNGVPVYWADSDAAVVLDGKTYLPRAPLGFSALTESQDKGGSGVTLTVPNVDLAVTLMVQAADPTGIAVVLRQAFLRATGGTVGYAVRTGLVVNSYQADEAAFLFALLEGAAGQRARVPARVCGRSCWWVYQGAECGYAGAEADCDHSRAGCRWGADAGLHFGGIPPAVPVS